MDKAKALEIAEWFEAGMGGCELEAAAELRRLHAENQELREEVAELRAWLEVETGRVKQAVAAEHQARQRVINGLKLLHDSFSMASKENKT